MACAGIGWSWDDLAREADVSRDTIARFLRGDDLKSSTVAIMRGALEAAGVEFIAENGGGPGVRLRAP
jgi:transcriptional regulator with XRE-family HTH domain